jgi:hypothetical protein
MKQAALVLAALLVAAVLPFAAVEAQEKERIAVGGPLYVSAAIPEEALSGLDPVEIIGAFEKALRDSRKFTVLSRREAVEAQIVDVDQRSGTGFYENGGHSLDGKLLERYRMTLALRAFEFERYEDPVAALEGRYRRIDRASLAMEAQVVDTQTGVIVGSYRTQAEQASAPLVVSRPGGSPSASILFEASTRAARAIVRDFLDNVFPMRVVNASEDRVWINAGGEDAVERGEALTVYGLGAALIDPDTGENLGATEIEKATVTIIQVRPKFSVAEITESREAVAIGDILRR